ncbi:MAG: hypothetical protein ACRD3W_00475 [Terriglobales bacterium]
MAGTPLVVADILSEEALSEVDTPSVEVEALSEGDTRSVVALSEVDTPSAEVLSEGDTPSAEARPAVNTHSAVNILLAKALSVDPKVVA